MTNTIPTATVATRVSESTSLETLVAHLSRSTASSMARSVAALMDREIADAARTALSAIGISPSNDQSTALQLWQLVSSGLSVRDVRALPYGVITALAKAFSKVEAAAHRAERNEANYPSEVTAFFSDLIPTHQAVWRIVGTKSGFSLFDLGTETFYGNSPGYFETKPVIFSLEGGTRLLAGRRSGGDYEFFDLERSRVVPVTGGAIKQVPEIARSPFLDCEVEINGLLKTDCVAELTHSAVKVLPVSSRSFETKLTSPARSVIIEKSGRRFQICNEDGTNVNLPSTVQAINSSLMDRDGNILLQVALSGRGTPPHRLFVQNQGESLLRKHGPFQQLRLVRLPDESVVAIVGDAPARIIDATGERAIGGLRGDFILDSVGEPQQGRVLFSLYARSSSVRRLVALPEGHVVERHPGVQASDSRVKIQHTSKLNRSWGLHQPSSNRVELFEVEPPSYSIPVEMPTDWEDDEDLLSLQLEEFPRHGFLIVRTGSTGPFQIFHRGLQSWSPVAAHRGELIFAGGDPEQAHVIGVYRTAPSAFDIVDLTGDRRTVTTSENLASVTSILPGPNGRLAILGPEVDQKRLLVIDVHTGDTLARFAAPAESSRKADRCVITFDPRTGDLVYLLSSNRGYGAVPTAGFQE